MIGIKGQSQQFSFCGICTVPYDFIASVETLDRDLAYVMEVLNVTQYSEGTKSTPMHHLNPSKGQSAMDYFRTLSKRQKDGLYRIFRLDFEAFGYSAEKYLDA